MVVEGLEEGFVNQIAQFTLTTRDAEGRQCYNEDDHATVEIINEQGPEGVTEEEIVDSRVGLYRISYSPRDLGRFNMLKTALLP